MERGGQVVVVTGSARGFGEGFAEAALKAGARVTVCDVLLQEGKATAARLGEKYGKKKVFWCPCDVTKESDWANLFDSTEENFGSPVDVLVNNAGVIYHAGHRKCIDVNTVGVMLGSELAIDRWGKVKGSGRGGHIINVASLAGIGKPTYRAWLPYYVSKAGVVHLTKCLGAGEVFKQEGVRVNCICPGFADTRMVHDHEDVLADAKSFGFDLIPVGRVVDAFLALAADASAPSGRALCVLPDGAPHVQWPTGDEYLLYFFLAGALLLHKLSPATRVFSHAWQLLWLAACLLLAYLMLKVLQAFLF